MPELIVTNALSARALDKRLAAVDAAGLTMFRFIATECGDSYIPNIVTYLAQSTLIKHFELKACALTDECLPQLGGLLRTMPAITTLSLSDNNFTHKGAHELARVVAALPELTSLALGGTHMADEGLADVLLALRNCPVIRVLDLHGTPRRITRAEAIAPPATEAQSTETVHVIGKHSFGALRTVAAFHDKGDKEVQKFSLQQLLLTGTDFSVADGNPHAFSLALPSLISFAKLDLTSAKVSAAALYVLCPALIQLRHFHTFYLANNNFGDAAMVPLREMLENTATKVRSLGLQGNGITAAGCAVLGAGLRANKLLRELDLSHNPIGADGCAELATGLKDNAGLQNLLLDSIGGDGAAVRNICRALDEHPTMQHLDFINNDTGTDGCDAWCEFLDSPGCQIRRLYLSNNGFDAAASTKLTEVLLRTKVYSATLDENAFTYDQISQIKACLRKNKPDRQASKQSSPSASTCASPRRPKDGSGVQQGDGTELASGSERRSSIPCSFNLSSSDSLRYPDDMTISMELHTCGASDDFSLSHTDGQLRHAFPGQHHSQHHRSPTVVVVIPADAPMSTEEYHQQAQQLQLQAMMGAQKMQPQAQPSTIRIGPYAPAAPLPYQPQGHSPQTSQTVRVGFGMHPQQQQQQQLQFAANVGPWNLQAFHNTQFVPMQAPPTFHYAFPAPHSS